MPHQDFLVSPFKTKLEKKKVVFFLCFIPWCSIYLWYFYFKIAVSSQCSTQPSPNSLVAANVASCSALLCRICWNWYRFQFTRYTTRVHSGWRSVGTQMSSFTESKTLQCTVLMMAGGAEFGTVWASLTWSGEHENQNLRLHVVDEPQKSILLSRR